MTLLFATLSRLEDLCEIKNVLSNDDNDYLAQMDRH